MKSMSKLGKFGTLVVAVSATVLGVFAAQAQAARCICPLYYAPVTCSNGRTYSNICFARCNNATNCVPSGGGVFELQ